MISIQDAFGWLNQQGRTRLKNDMIINFFQLQDDRIPLSQRDRLARDIWINSQQIADRMERFEVLINLGYVFATWKKWQDADLALREATEGYQKSSHEWAVAHWMRGIIQWNFNEHNQAYGHWFEARKAILKCHAAKVAVADTQMSLWYTQIIEKIKIEMAKKVEEANYWLNIHEPSRLSAVAKQFTDQMILNIRSRKYPEAYEFGNYLLGISRGAIEMRETAEAWEKVGLAAWQMGDARKSIEYWKRGVSAYEPMSHQSATLKWMIGIAEWSLPSEYENALTHCQDAIDMYGYCQTVADRGNRQSEREWYQVTIPVMTKALEELRRSILGF